MGNKIQKIEKEKNQLLLEVESKLDLLVNGQKINSNKTFQSKKSILSKFFNQKKSILLKIFALQIPHNQVFF